MRVMVMIRSNPNTEAGVPMSEQSHGEMLKFSRELAEAGVLLDAGRLHPSARGTRVHLAGGQAIVSDGPFAETKELIAGFSVWEVASREEAVEWIRRSPLRDAEIEIRELFDSDDFHAELTPELKQEAERLGALMAAKPASRRA
jgi:hypothetical protein